MRKQIRNKVPFLVLISTIIIFNSNIAFSQVSKDFKDMFIIVLDVQNRDTQNDKLKISATRMIDSINFIIKDIDTNKIIYVKTLHKLLNLCLSRPFIYVSFDTSAFCDMDDRLNIVNEIFFSKEQNNAFAIKRLRDFLDQNNAKKIAVAGLLAEECISETLKGGKELGYEMYVIPEAIIGKSEKSKSKMIRHFKKEGINILHIK